MNRTSSTTVLIKLDIVSHTVRFASTYHIWMYHLRTVRAMANEITKMIFMIFFDRSLEEVESRVHPIDIDHFRHLNVRQSLNRKIATCDFSLRKFLAQNG